VNALEALEKAEKGMYDEKYTECLDAQREQAAKMDDSVEKGMAMVE